MWLPAASFDVSNVVPPLVMGVPPSTVQSTLMTAGSTTFTFSVAAVVAPAGGSVESMGVTARQMVKTMFSRDTELKLVSAFEPNKLFIIELQEGRHSPLPT